MNCRICKRELTEPEDHGYYCGACRLEHNEPNCQPPIGVTYDEEYPLSTGPFSPNRTDPNLDKSTTKR